MFASDCFNLFQQVKTIIKQMENVIKMWLNLTLTSFDSAKATQTPTYDLCRRQGHCGRQRSSLFLRLRHNKQRKLETWNFQRSWADDQSRGWNKNFVSRTEGKESRSDKRQPTSHIPLSPGDKIIENYSVTEDSMWKFPPPTDIPQEIHRRLPLF